MAALTVRQLLITLGIDIAIALIVFTIFSALRRTKTFLKWFDARGHIERSECKYRPPKPDTGFFGWLSCAPFAKTYSRGRDYLETCGSDATVYDWVIKFGLEMAVVLGLINLATCLPVNLVGDNVDDELQANRNTRARQALAGEARDPELALTTLDHTSMANVDKGDLLMFVHVAACWITTFYFLYRLHALHRRVVELRVLHSANACAGGDARSVLVLDVPGVPAGSKPDRLVECSTGACGCCIPGSSIEKMKAKANNLAKTNSSSTDRAGGQADQWSLVPPERVTDMNPDSTAADRLRDCSYEDMVKKEFDGVYRNQVVAVNGVAETSKASAITAAYRKTQQTAQDLVDDYTIRMKDGTWDASKHRKSVKIFTRKEGAWATAKFGNDMGRTEVDKLTYLEAKLEHLYGKLQQELPEARASHFPAAFVTFRDRSSKACAATALHHHDRSTWRVRDAPEPRDIVWGNLKYRGWERALRTAIVWAIFVLMCLFYLIPVGIVQVFISQLPEEVPGLFDIPVVGAILLGVLPSLALVIFMAIMPKILAFLRKKQGLVAGREIDAGVVTQFYIFQFIVVFVYTFISGSLLAQAQALAEDPGSIISLLGAGVPQNANFFMSYLLSSGVVAGSIKIIRLVPTVLYWIKTKITSSPRARKRLWSEQSNAYGTAVAPVSIALLLGLVYAQIQPLVLIAVALYFLIASIVWRYNSIHVYKERYQSGGRLWLQIFTQLWFSLLVSQVVMIGYLGIKEFPYAAALVPLPIFTLIFVATAQSKKPAIKTTSMRLGADVDEKERAADTEGGPMSEVAKRELHELYQPDCFKVSEEEHASTLAEITEAGKILSGLPVHTKGGSSLRGSSQTGK